MASSGSTAEHFLIKKISDEAPPWVTCLITHYRKDRNRKKPNTRQDSNSEFLLTLRAVYPCAETAVLQFQITVGSLIMWIWHMDSVELEVFMTKESSFEHLVILKQPAETRTRITEKLCPHRTSIFRCAGKVAFREVIISWAHLVTKPHSWKPVDAEMRGKKGLTGGKWDTMGKFKNKLASQRRSEGLR